METVVLKKKYVLAAAAGLCVLVGLCIFFVLSCRAIAVYPQEKSFKINGKKYNVKSEAFIYNGYDYLPAGDVLPPFGYTLKWDSEKETLYIEKKGKTGSIAAESNIYKSEGKEERFEQPAKMHEERIYLNTKMLKKITGKNFKLHGNIKKTVKDTAIFDAADNGFVLNGAEKKADDIPAKIGGTVMVSAKSVLSQCGYSVSEKDGVLKAEHFGVKTEISEKKIVSNGKKSAEKALMYHERLFISLKAFSFISGIEAEIKGNIRESSFGRRDCLEDTQPTDKYRKKDYEGTYNGVTIADGAGMELLGISEKASEKYAEIINKTADALKDVKVYNIIVPSAGEFYAPESVKVSQIKGIKAAYKRLDKKIMPINVYAALEEKADEYIFFRTDHHWTQRGAYYAYREFANQKGMYLPPLDEFKTEKIYGYLGSFEAFAAGTPGAAMLAANPDEFEKFYPNVKAKCTFYTDCKMENKTGESDVVSDYHSYTSFIGGDHPVTKIETDVKNGKKLVIIKESYGNAFATWAVNNYETVYTVDPREFNGFGGKTESFDLNAFYEETKFDDLIIITYPVSTISEGIRKSISKMTD